MDHRGNLSTEGKVSITLGPKLRLIKPGVYAHWCPGCKGRHFFNLYADDNPGGAKWDFNGDIYRPSFSPSMHIKITDHDTRQQETLCHYYLREGQLQFLSDSGHELKGQTIDLPDFPYGVTSR